MAQHHRSMNKEAVLILSKVLNQASISEAPAPYKGRFPLTDAFIDAAKRKGRG